MRLTQTILWLSVFNAIISAQQFPDFNLKNIDNQNINTSDLKGEKLTILDFWATWCKPCVSSIPKLITISDLYKEKGVQFIGVNMDSPRNMAKVKPFSNSLGINYPVIFDTNQELATEFSVTAIPTIIILDAIGNRLYTHEGFAMGDEKNIEQKIQEILDKK